jgi:V8-like Glu-specific endopeptidase
MVSPSLLMTNNHVLTSEEDCKRSIAQFNYEKSEDLFDKPHVSFRLEPEKFFYTNEKLDFSLVSVSQKSSSDNSLSDFKFLKLIKQIGKAVIGEYVSIIQHPRGSPKQVAIRENRVIDIFDDFIHYICDTEPGASGSPVCNDQWEVVSLHHSGVPKTDENGNYLTKDGQIWTENMGEDKIEWVGNEGVRISSIVKDLENQLTTMSVEQKPLLEELLKLTK